MKYDLKFKIGFFPKRVESLSAYFEQYSMKKITDAATTLNEAIIAKHGYTKLTSHLDFAKLTTTDGYLDIDDYTGL